MNKFTHIRLTLLAIILLSGNLFASKGVWTAGNPFPSINRNHFAKFILGGKAYIGMGSYVNGSTLTFTKDVWEFDPITDTWTQKADFGGNIRTGILHFQVGDTGYAGCGADQFAVYNDFWKFDPAANQWSQIAYFPGPPRVYGQGFNIDTLGFCGLGRTFTAAGATITYNDIYQYSPSTNTWTSKNNFPGNARSYASTFTINGYPYLLAGQSGNAVNALWRYDAAGDSWLQRSAFPGGNRIAMSALVIQDTAYAGLGRSQDPLTGITTYYNDFWCYEPVSDVWTQYTSMPGAPRFHAYAFGIDTIGYVGCGENVATSYNDTWHFNPRLETTGVGIDEPSASAVHFYHDIQNGKVQISGMNGNDIWVIRLFATNGQLMFTTRLQNTPELQVDLTRLVQGAYLMNVENGKAKKTFRFVKGIS